MNISKIFNILKTKKYNIEYDLVIFDNNEFEQFAKITEGYKFVWDEIKVYFKGTYFSVSLEELLNHTFLDEEEKEIIKNRMFEKECA